MVVDFELAERAYLGQALSSVGVQARSVSHIDEVRAAQVVIIAASRADAGVISSIETLRLRHAGAMVMVATDADSLDERLACYEAGADDCMFRPFRLVELAAKIKALRRRRATDVAMPLLSTGDAVVDWGSLELRVSDRAQSLTKREVELLTILAQADGGVVHRERVLREAWGGPAWMTNNSVDVYVGYVRRKLDLLGSDVTVKTVRGFGFQIVRRKTRTSAAGQNVASAQRA